MRIFVGAVKAFLLSESLKAFESTIKTSGLEANEFGGRIVANAKALPDDYLWQFVSWSLWFKVFRKLFAISSSLIFQSSKKIISHLKQDWESIFSSTCTKSLVTLRWNVALSHTSSLCIRDSEFPPLRLLALRKFSPSDHHIWWMLAINRFNNHNLSSHPFAFFSLVSANQSTLPRFLFVHITRRLQCI